MLEIMRDIELNILPRILLEQPFSDWNSLLIDYHQPFVYRVWIQVKEYRVSFHMIDPCESDEALFHPHPWPSAMRILIGRYEMGIGYGEVKPPIAARIVLAAGSTYEMTDPNSWHYVRPIEPSFTLMVTGKPFDKPSSSIEKASKKLFPLEDNRKEMILRMAQTLYVKV